MHIFIHTHTRARARSRTHITDARPHTHAHSHTHPQTHSLTYTHLPLFPFLYPPAHIHTHVILQTCSSPPSSPVYPCHRWNASLPGYNPDNSENVEWYAPDPSAAVAISWRDWGSQIRVVPAQNVLAPRVLNATLPRIAALSGIIAKWYAQLPPADRWLLGGVKVGWEAGYVLPLVP